MCREVLTLIKAELCVSVDLGTVGQHLHGLGQRSMALSRYVRKGVPTHTELQL
jgi:hypothetical protein